MAPASIHSLPAGLQSGLRSFLGKSSSKDMDALLAAAYKQLHDDTIAPAVWRAQARAFLSGGEPDRCRLVLETLLHSAPDDVAAHLMLGEAALQAGPASCDEAVAACRHAHKLAQNADAQLKAHIACALGVALGTKARVASITPAHRAELREGAASIMQASARDCPQQLLRATLCYNLALVSAELGLLGPALQHAHAALAAAEKLPADGEQLLVGCVLLVALLLTAKQQLPQALAVLTVLDQPHTFPSAAVGEDGASSSATPPPSDAAPQTLTSRMQPAQHVLVARIQAGVLSAQGDHLAAVTVLTHCRKSLAASSATATAQLWQELTAACSQAGAAADACYCAEQALQMEPWSADSHGAAGLAHEAAGRYTQALDSYSTALALDPQHALSLMHQGVLLAKAGSLTQLSAARDLISEGLRLEPTSATGWFQLGQATKAMQHNAAAEKQLRNAVLLAETAPVIPFAALPLSYPREAPQ